MPGIAANVFPKSLYGSKMRWREAHTSGGPWGLGSGPLGPSRSLVGYLARSSRIGELRGSSGRVELSQHPAPGLRSSEAVSFPESARAELELRDLIGRPNSIPGQSDGGTLLGDQAAVRGDGRRGEERDGRGFPSPHYVDTGPLAGTLTGEGVFCTDWRTVRQAVIGAAGLP